MGLILTLKQGEDFFIDGRQFVLEEVYGPAHFLLRDVETDTAHEITDERLAEVGPDVLVCAAVSPRQVHISIEAPHEIAIERGKLRKGRRR